MDLIFILNLTCRRVTLRAVRCPRLSPLEALLRYIAIWRPTRCCHRLPEDSDPATEWWSEMETVWQVSWASKDNLSLRGYGDSSKPPDGENHSAYSKRAMAQDRVELMGSLGF